MAWSITLGRVYGTAVRIHLTFLLLLLFIWLSSYRLGGAEQAWNGVVYISLLFACVLLHEFGHIFAARRYGIRTPEVTLWPFGGVASLERIPEKPGEELVVALAGPAVNVVIALLLFVVLGAQPEAATLARIEDPTSNLLTRLASANLFLVAFNLLPAFPMDGGRVLRALLAYRMGAARATAIAARIGQGFAFLLAFLGLFSNPMLIVIALFIFMAASQEAAGMQMRALSQGLRAEHGMVRAFVSLPPGATVGDAVDALIATTQKEFPVVDGAGMLRGVLTRDAIIKALRETGPPVPVIDVMHRDVPTMPAWARLDDAFRLMSEAGAPAVAVTGDDGRLVGLVTPENVGEMLMVEAARPGFSFGRRKVAGAA